MGDDQSAADVFALLSDETRVDILRTVAVAQHDRHLDGPAQLSFSDIYDRVDVDNTSKLSYHLGELTGTFLRKDEPGYSFTHAGEKIVRFVLAANYESPRGFGPIPVNSVCPFCDSRSLQARPNHQMLLAECTECDRPVSAYDIPPAQVRDRTDEEILTSIKHKDSAHYKQVRDGVCPECAGPLSTTVLTGEEIPHDHQGFLVLDDCRECLRRYNAPMAYSVAYHPASVAFHWDHGIDISRKALWELHEYAADGQWTSKQRGTDPDEYVIELRHDTDMLRLYLDSEADVTHTERVRRHSGAES